MSACELNVCLMNGFLRMNVLWAEQPQSPSRSQASPLRMRFPGFGGGNLHPRKLLCPQHTDLDLSSRIITANRA